MGGGRGRGGLVDAEEKEIVETALIDAVEAGLVAVEESEIGGGGETAEGGGKAAEVVGSFVLAGETVLEQAALDGPEAAHAPVGGGHFLDHSEFDAIHRFEAIEVAGDQGVELGAGFATHDDAIGEQSMAQRIGRRAAFPLRGLRAF